jgi:hypothetical protein
MLLNYFLKYSINPIVITPLDILLIILQPTVGNTAQTRIIPGLKLALARRAVVAYLLIYTATISRGC